MDDDKRVYLYDSTLRDGAQTQGVNFSAQDKIIIAQALDALGIDYIEGGWPGANPTDDAFFAHPPRLTRARLTAFGMTRRAGRSAENDPGLQALLQTEARLVTLVGKSWDFQAEVALGVDLDENVRMIADSIRLAATRMDEAMFDAEHFFDGYKENADYAIKCVKAAYDAGARWVVLCDTNGGTLPHEITEIITAVTQHVPGSHLGIHCHNDTENAVANSLAAVRAGVRQVQGALNGLGERCGNANLMSIIPSLMLKMGYQTGLTDKDLQRLTHVSRLLDDRLNRAPAANAAYVGASAFAHKGGLHVSAVAKAPRTYEHVPPETVGNQRNILVSDQAGRSNLLARFDEIGLNIDPKHPKIPQVLDRVKEAEGKGYSYDGAEASFELLARQILETVPAYYDLQSYRVIDERRFNAKGALVTQSEASLRVAVNGTAYFEVAEGDGPVDALNKALRKVLEKVYPALGELQLADYKVRILSPDLATAAITRVIMECSDASGHRWSTVGVDKDVINASYNALHDSITYMLLKHGVPSLHC